MKTLPPCKLWLANMHTMIHCAQSASKPSTRKGSIEWQSSALQSLLNLYIQVCAVPALPWPWKTIDTIYCSSTTTQDINPYSCSQFRKQAPACPRTRHFRPELTQWDTWLSDASVIMDVENTTIRSFRMSSHPAVLHTSQGLHTPNIRTLLLNNWPIQSLKRPGQWCLTARLPFNSGEKQLIGQLISIKDHQINAWKEMTTMATKQNAKPHMRCWMQLVNQRMILTAMKYRLKRLSPI